MSTEQIQGEKVVLLAQDCALDESNIYFIALRLNLLFSVNIDSGKITLIDCVPSSITVCSELFGGIIVVDNKIVISPAYENKIWIYDLQNCTWKGLERKMYSNEQIGTIRLMMVHQDYLYLIGSAYPAIIRVNCKTWQIEEYITAPYKDKGVHQNSYFRSHAARVGDVVYLASCCDNTVLKYCFNTGDYEWIEVGSKSNSYSGICFDGKDFWLSPRWTGPIVRWNGTDMCEEYELPRNHFTFCQNYIMGCCYKNGKVYFPNMTSECSLVANNEDFEIELLPLRFSMMKRDGNVIISETYEGNLELIIDDEKRVFRLEVSEKELAYFFQGKKRNLYGDISVFHENEIHNINGFIKYV